MTDLDEILHSLRQQRYLVREARDGSGALLDLAGEHSAELNPSALFILNEILQDESEADEIAAKVTELFGIERQSAKAQVQGFLETLAAQLRGRALGAD